MSTPLFICYVISAHAPHQRNNEADKTWTRIIEKLRPYRDQVCILCIDANTNPDKTINRFFGGLGSNVPGTYFNYFHDLAAMLDIRVCTTFPELVRGEKRLTTCISGGVNVTDDYIGASRSS